MGVFSRFKNIGKTLGGGAIRGVGSGIVGAATGIHQLQLFETVFPFVSDPFRLPNQIEVDAPNKFTGDPVAEQIRTYAMSIGMDQLVAGIAEQMKSGQPISEQQLDQLLQGTSFLGSLYNGNADLGQSAALNVLAFISSAAEGDYSSNSFLVGLAKAGSTLPTAAQPEDDALAQSLLEQQELALEQQRITTLMAQRNYEREGILSIIQMLPSANRLEFMSAMFQTPKFAQLFFGDLDAGSNDGPYVGSVLGSLGAGPTTPTSSATPLTDTQTKLFRRFGQ